MAQLYNRNFNVGRGSEQLHNEELHRHYKILEHYLDSVLDSKMTTDPAGTMDSAIWHYREDNELKWFDKNNNTWRNFYENKFALTEHIMDVLPPSNPIRGQLWLHQGVLCYYDGTTWQPIKAIAQDGSQFSLDVFKNFLLISPLWKTGNTVVADNEIVRYTQEVRKYLNGLLNAADNSKDALVVDDNSNPTTWNFSETKTTENSPLIPEFTPDVKMQFIVPQIDYARLFLDRTLDTTKYEEVSKVCIQYKKDDIKNTVVSLAHINPGRITKIIKRLFIVDKINPKIQLSAANTEYYGFRFDSRLGDFLVPDGVNQEGIEVIRDYTIVEDGILLETHAAQNYDYVLAITYEFSWLKTTGSMTKTTSGSLSNIYYVQDYIGPMIPFVDGYNLEDPYFTDDSTDKTILFKEDITNRDVSLLHVPKREYGYIRYVDLDNCGIIKPIKNYKNPIVFINGEALYGNYTVDNKGWIHVPEAKLDMAWSIIDIYDNEKDENLFLKAGTIIANDEEYISTYNVPECEANALNAESNIARQVYAIKFNDKDLDEDDNIILFVNGLLLKKEEVCIDRNTGFIYVYTGYQNENIDINKYNSDLQYKADIDAQINKGDIEGNNLIRNGLSAGCEFVIIKDRYGWLYDETKLMPALGVGSLSDTLVYMNGKLLCSRKESIPYISAKDTTKDIYGNEILHNQIVRKSTDLNEVIDRVAALEAYDSENQNYTYQFYDKQNKTYKEFPNDEHINAIKLVSESYVNGMKSIQMLFDYSLADTLDVYAFTTANANVEQPLIVTNEEIQIGKSKQEFTTSSTFNPNTNSLMVWVDGVRMYPNTDDVKGIIELSDGTGFILPEPVGGDGSIHYVTAVLEKPEKDAVRSCERRVITDANIAPNVINVYSTKYTYDKNGNKTELANPLSLYPGRVTMYVNGIRQPEDSYTIHDNYTFSFNDLTIIGSNKNYPKQVFIDDYGNERTLTHNQPDYILIEVREDNRQVSTFEIKDFPTYEINPTSYDLPIDILEASDEIMIFINGLYFGPKKNEGYFINLSRGTITLTDQNTCDIINSDGMYEALAGNDIANQLYLLRHNNVPYEHAKSKITLEWR